MRTSAQEVLGPGPKISFSVITDYFAGRSEPARDPPSEEALEDPRPEESQGAEEVFLSPVRSPGWTPGDPGPASDPAATTPSCPPSSGSFVSENAVDQSTSIEVIEVDQQPATDVSASTPSCSRPPDTGTSTGTPDTSTPRLRRSTRKRKPVDLDGDSGDPEKRETPTRVGKRSKPTMAGVGRSPANKAGNPKGNKAGTDTNAGAAKGPDPTPTESAILKEMMEMKALMGGMEERLEKKVEEGANTTLRAVATLEGRVMRNERELEPKINRALDNKLSLIHI